MLTWAAATLIPFAPSSATMTLGRGLVPLSFMAAASFRISSDLLMSPAGFFEALVGFGAFFFATGFLASLVAGAFGVAASVGCVVESVVMTKVFRW